MTNVGIAPRFFRPASLVSESPFSRTTTGYLCPAGSRGVGVKRVLVTHLNVNRNRSENVYPAPQPNDQPGMAHEVELRPQALNLLRMAGPEVL